MGLQDIEARTTRAIGVVDDDAKGDRKPSHDAFARTDEEASFDLAAKFLRMDRATRRAIALQYQPDESFMDASPDELSPIKIDEGRQTCSTKLEVHPTLPFRGKESDYSLKSRKYCRSIPSIDSLESRPESTKETARERISGDSGYGSDYRRRRIQSEYLRSADGSIQRREAAAGADSTGTTANPQSQQGRQHRIPAQCSESTGDSDGNSSIESSVFSIPESPVEEHHIHPDDPFQHHLDDAITAITRHYREWQVQQRGSSTGEKGTKRASVSTPESSHHARKRPHTGKQDRTRLDDDDDAGPGYKRAKFPASSSASGRQLACPFWKKDPENHRQCHKKVLSKIKYVKQHLYQVHEAPITSACCGAVFETEDAHDQHVRARQCQIIPGGVQRQGLTRAQIQEIHRRADPRKTEEEKWFAIWDICFPGHPHPTSAYIDNDLSEDLRSFREYFTSQGANIISGFLHGSPSDRRIENEHVVLSSALERIYDDWAAARGLRPIPSLPTPPRTEPSNPTDSDGGSHVSLPMLETGTHGYTGMDRHIRVRTVTVAGLSGNVSIILSK
ncbi:hypothetical protein KHU50_004605 [Colletotrichum sp. SAR 10_65]|nr:hypothetical protein KHU50_004605 [Colletotrichum sp. SAR 10_65]